MNTFHIHLGVDELEPGIRFYSALFGQKPTVSKPDYAKWALVDPRVNFAISTRTGVRGLDHLGVQADSDPELADIRRRLDAAGIEGVEQESTECCYASSDKYWSVDPQGIPWESFHTLGEARTYAGGRPAGDNGKSCCAPCG